MALNLIERVEQVTLRLQEQLPVRDVAGLFPTQERYQWFAREAGGIHRNAFVDIYVSGKKGNPESPIDVIVSSISNVPEPVYDQDLLTEIFGVGALDFLRERVDKIRAALPSEMRNQPLKLNLYSGISSSDDIVASETVR